MAWITKHRDALRGGPAVKFLRAHVTKDQVPAFSRDPDRPLDPAKAFAQNGERLIRRHNLPKLGGDEDFKRGRMK